MAARRKKLITLVKYNPKGFWREIQQKTKKTDNNISVAHWVDYVKLLYERYQEKSNPPIINSTTKLFLVEKVKRGIKNLASGKAQDIDGLQAGVEILAPIIKRIFNRVT